MVDWFIKNANVVYYTILIIGALYTGFRIFTNKLKKSKIYNSVSLITEVPLIVKNINDKQEEVLREVRLQGRLISEILETLELAQFVCDAEGMCIKVNSRWTTLTGMSEEDARGHHWMKALHPEDKDRVTRKWKMMLEENIPFEEVFRYKHRITKIITKVKCTATEIYDEEGNRIYVLGLSRLM